MSKMSGRLVSNRQLLGSGIGAALRLPTAFSTAQQRSGAPTEELVMVNGRIHTMDRNNTLKHRKIEF